MNFNKCLHCGYEWNTKSMLSIVTCPNCLRKTKNINIEDANYN